MMTLPNNDRAPESPGTIAVADSMWVGHHPMYFEHFTATLLKQGWRVLALCPEPAGLEAAMRAAGIETAGTLRAARLVDKMSPLARWGREHDPLSTMGRWWRLRRELGRLEKTSGWRADSVFFPYIDNFTRFLPVPMVPGLTIGRPWAGLYFRNHHFSERRAGLKGMVFRAAKGDGIFRSRDCRVVGVLDERFTATMERELHKPVLVFPDFTNAVLPDEHTPLVRDMLAKAAGRKIIGLMGLEKRKGFLTMMKVADRARAAGEPWYFVFAGPYYNFLYTADERAYVDGIVAGIRSGAIGNIHFEPTGGRIPGDAEYNDLFSSFDVVWAAYEDFHGSSGTLSKAAAFRLPVLASAGECVGDRVEKFGLGVTIPEGDVAAAGEGIRLLLQGMGWRGEPLAPDHAGFAARHSLARLDEVVREMTRLMTRGDLTGPAR